MNTAAAGHVPVMLDRVRELLASRTRATGAVLVDATLGRAGHTIALLADHPGLSVIGIDADQTAIEESTPAARRRRAPGHAGARRLRPDPRDTGGPWTAQRAGQSCSTSGCHRPSLTTRPGVSLTPMTRRSTCGWTRESGLTAAEVVNTYPRRETGARSSANTGRNDLPGGLPTRWCASVRGSRSNFHVPAGRDRQELDPRAGSGALAATRRSAPSRRCASRSTTSLAALRRAVPAALDAVAVGGRIVVLAYHSLEDRIVKREFVKRSTDSTPLGLPVPLASARPQFRLLVSGAEQPGQAELTANPRAASAKLRAAERIRAA